MARGNYLSAYTGEEVDSVVELLPRKQDLLVSGLNIKTVNNASILGSGNIESVTKFGGVTGAILLGQNLVMDDHTLKITGELGTNVVANPIPQGTASYDLNTITIGDVTYNIAGSGHDGTIYEKDTTTTNINFAFTSCLEKAYTQQCTTVSVSVPSSVDQGFQSCLTFVTGGSAPSFSITNYSTTYGLNMLQYGRKITTYRPATNCTATLLFFNDGVNSNLYIFEADRA